MNIGDEFTDGHSNAGRKATEVHAYNKNGNKNMEPYNLIYGPVDIIVQT